MPRAASATASSVPSCPKPPVTTATRPERSNSGSVTAPIVAPRERPRAPTRAAWCRAHEQDRRWVDHSRTRAASALRCRSIAGAGRPSPRGRHTAHGRRRSSPSQRSSSRDARPRRGRATHRPRAPASPHGRDGELSSSQQRSAPLLGRSRPQSVSPRVAPPARRVPPRLPRSRGAVRLPGWLDRWSLAAAIGVLAAGAFVLQAPSAACRLAPTAVDAARRSPTRRWRSPQSRSSLRASTSVCSPS